MNWLAIVVLLTLVLSTYCGYKKGFLRIAYSLVAWVLIFVFVSWSTPYLARYLTEHTKLADSIREKCEEHLLAAAEGSAETSTGTATDVGAEALTGTDTDVGAEVSTGTDLGINTDALAELGMNLPSALLEKLQQQSAGDFLEQSGIYEAIAQTLTQYIIKAIAGLISLAVAVVLAFIIGRVLGLVSKIPIIHGINQGIGIFAGAVYGLLLVWVGMCIIALCIGSDAGRMLYSYVQENELLLLLYENNPIITLFF